jgi:hypothetical protein
MLTQKTGKICIYMHHQTTSKIKKFIHTYIQMSIFLGCKKEICICIKIQSLVIINTFSYMIDLDYVTLEMCDVALLGRPLLEAEY